MINTFELAQMVIDVYGDAPVIVVDGDTEIEFAGGQVLPDGFSAFYDNVQRIEMKALLTRFWQGQPEGATPVYFPSDTPIEARKMVEKLNREAGTRYSLYSLCESDWSTGWRVVEYNHNWGYRPLHELPLNGIALREKIGAVARDSGLGGVCVFDDQMINAYGRKLIARDIKTGEIVHSINYDDQDLNESVMVTVEMNEYLRQNFYVWEMNNDEH